ncbi:amidohydrolase family protein [Parasphingorhabdus sp.]|uniref:amidohydrolase family protein n=1 Tax=Parasphingorhabdus sp. TaxID=2709688 RepID=UPI003266B2E1
MTIKGFFNPKRWAVGLLFFTILSTLGSYFFVDYQLDAMFGKYTERAETIEIDQRPEVFAISNVNILAPTSDRFSENQTVLIRDGNIVSVTSEPELASDIRTIDGTGMFLVPGYTDSHVHLWESENDLQLYIANGVTQVREMNGSDTHLQWKREIEQGRIGPDLFVVAPQLANFDLPGGWFTSWFQRKTNVRSQADIERAVQSFESKGYDAIKASSFLDKEGYAAISALTNADSLPLVGHLPMAIVLDDVWQSNQSAVAHVEEFMKALDREFGGYRHETAEDFLAFVSERSPDVAEHILRKGIVVTSTMALLDSFPGQKSNLDGVLKEAQLAYANPGITEGIMLTSRGMGWLPDVNIYRWPEEWDAQKRSDSLKYWQAYSDAQHIIFKALLEKGVPILAGTDANVPVTVPGFSLHEEMRALKDAGMTNAQVLASATSAPAQWMGWNTGKIQAGFKANLVLLREDPLLDISATDSIEMVIVNGNPLSRSQLDAMLLSVKTANDSSRKLSIEKWH